jgi:hypothetical protein|tara:strand:- start:205 stop:672 length:468 start_codon:yes stop_codon:yes gene_type:complete
MKEIKITKGMLRSAEKRAAEMGILKNSIRKGAGNLVGMLGEEIVLDVMGGDLKSSYDYDIVLPDGRTTDVKTKLTTVPPLPSYSCSVSAYNIHQDCDLYTFVRVKKDLTVGWYLGSLTKLEFFNTARFFEKGAVTGDNNHKVTASCYNCNISALH